MKLIWGDFTPNLTANKIGVVKGNLKQPWKTYRDRLNGGERNDRKNITGVLSQARYTGVGGRD